MSELKKCLYCGIEVPQTQGKRERKFCSASHCTLFHLREKKKDQPEKPKGRPKGSKNKGKVVEGTYGFKDGNMEVGATFYPTTADSEKFHQQIEDVRTELNTPSNDREYNWGNHGKESIQQLDKAMEDAFGHLVGVKKEELGKPSDISDTSKEKLNKEWKPKLSPFMLERQKKKGGSK